MATKLPETRTDFIFVEPNAPVIVAPPLLNGDIKNIEHHLNRYKKMLKERGHLAIDVEKRTEVRVLRDKWNADILRAYPYLRRDNPLERGKSRNYGTKEYTYEAVDIEKIATCKFDEKKDRFECRRL